MKFFRFINKFWPIVAIILCFICLIGNSIGEINKDRVFTATDQASWENTRDQSFSISGNYDSGADSSGIAVTSSSVAVPIEISTYLNPGYRVKLICVYTDQDIVVKIYGVGINALWNLDYITSNVRAGKSATWEFNDITKVEFLKVSGGTNATVDFYLRTLRDKELVEN